MRILVTGGAGYIGSHALRLFLARGHEAWAFDNLSAGHKEAVPAGRLIEGDLVDRDRLDQALVGQRIDAVIHFAALTDVGESVRDPGRYYSNNVVNTLRLLEALRRHRISRFVFSSTAATYGIAGRIPISEDEEPRPINPYGQGKLTIEKALEAYSLAYNWGVTSLRYFNAAGAAADGTLGEHHEPETHLIPIVLQSILGQRPHVEIFGTDYDTPDGTCIRDYVHVDDLALAHGLALERLEPGRASCYNLGIGRGYSVRDVIRTAESITGRTVPVREAARRPGDPPVLVAGAAKVRAELGWEPRHRELESIIETAWKWHRHHPRGFRDSVQPAGTL
jgi:UDP-glucose-4-epimerase GalE